MVDGNLEADIVIGSRIRLARNIAGLPFVDHATSDQTAHIEKVIMHEAESLSDPTIVFYDLAGLEELERQFVLDLERVSRAVLRKDQDLSSQPKASLLSEPVVSELSVQVNEEDHLRFSVTRNDCDLLSAWELLDRTDDRISQNIDFAFDSQRGFLTACPANLGTGLKASVMVHLPALAQTRQTEKVFRTLHKHGINVRGLFNDEASGNFFRVSNQLTLGLTESDLITKVLDAIPVINRFECKAREFVLDNNRDALRRDVQVAYENLGRVDVDQVREIEWANTLRELSLVRLGVALEMLDMSKASQIQSMFESVQLKKRLDSAIADENYQLAAELRDRIREIGEGGQS